MTLLKRLANDAATFSMVVNFAFDGETFRVHLTYGKNRSNWTFWEANVEQRGKRLGHSMADGVIAAARAAVERKIKDANWNQRSALSTSTSY
jgi:hypothetical protein